MSKYDVYSIESYEPGSNDLVIKNKLGIICPEEMKRVETQALERVYLDNSVWSIYNESHSFCIDDIYFLHNQWLEDIYFFRVKIVKADRYEFKYLLNYLVLLESIGFI